MTREEELFDKWANKLGEVFILTNAKADELLAELVRDFGLKDTGIRPKGGHRKLWVNPPKKT